MADRKAELERKKQKLAAIREEKERKRREKELRENAEDPTKSNKTQKDIRTEADELLSSLGIPSVDSPRSSTTATPEPSLSPAPEANAPTPASPASNRIPKKKTKLSVVNVHQANIPPKENVTYNKQTQTTAPSLDREAQPLDYYVLTYDDMPGEDESSASHDSSAFNKVASGLPHVEMVKPVITSDEEPKHREEAPISKVRELSDEQKQEILISEDFHKFFDKTSRIMERALEEEMDFLVDYSGMSGEEGDGDDKSGLKVSFNRCFSDDRWSKNRTITCLDWSTQFPELLVASYNNNEESPHDPDGVALIWNMRFKKTTPEYIFHCQSAVMSATFAKFHPNLIIGGTYSGQIVLWDNRSNKRTPVQRSPLTTAAHTQPVYCVNVVGTQNAHNLISVSTDGKFCSWSLDMLSAPQDTMELQHKNSKSVPVTSLSFPPGDVNNFAIGSEEGPVYTACRHGSKAGVLDIFEGHQGPVTGIDIHNSQGQIDFSHLFLTSSFDWTIKLWSFKENKFLYSFEDNADYVYDVSWSPIHPTLFAAVDGMGRLDLWNLNNDTEVPTAGVVIDGAPALNRVTWTPSGHQVAAGDDSGRIWIHDIGEQLAVPRNDEWSRFVHTLQEIKNNQANVDMEGSLPSSFSSLSTTPLR